MSGGQRYTVREIANAISVNPSSVKRRAARESWPYTEVTGRGGKRRLYRLCDLPLNIQSRLHRQAALEVTQATAIEIDLEALSKAARETNEARLKTKEQSLAEFAGLPDGRRKRRVKARMAILEMLWAWRRHHQGSKAATRLAFCEALNQGEIKAPQWILDLLPQYRGRHALTEPTLERWEQAYDARGIMALADGYGNRTGQSKISQNETLYKIVLGAILNNPHITGKKVKQFLAARHPDLDIVSEGAIRRFITHWKRDNAQIWTYLTNPDKWKNIYMAAHGSHFDAITHINQLWEMDSTPADWMLEDGRHCVIGAIDMFSRRLKFRVSKTSKAAAVALTFRDAVISWGVPEAVRTDNGQDYVSQHFNGVLRDLEVMHELCIFFASEEKGTIERAMRTMSHGILDLLPGFIGHNVAERKEIEARKSFAERIMTPGEVIEVAMTSEDLQQRLDDWCEHIYGKDPHAGLDGRSPFEVAAGQPVRRISDLRALDMLLEEVAGVRTVTKKGIKFEHHWYIAPELVSHMQQEVRLRRDPDDIGRLYVYSHEGAFVCIAECSKLLGISPMEKAIVAKARQKAWLAEQRDALKAMRRECNENIADAILQHRIEQSERVVAFPGRSETYTTDALEAAAEAAEAANTTTPQQDIDPENYAAFVAEFEQREAEVVEMDDPRRLHAYWLRIGERIDNHEAVSQEEREGWDIYRQSEHYQSQQQFFEAFGLTAEDFA